MFFRNKEVKKEVAVIKLYLIDSTISNNAKAQLLETLLSYFENQFGEMPEEYVIHGPYGVPKGSTVGLRAFRNKLKIKGHDKYYGLNGSTQNKFGFSLSVDCHWREQAYSELIIWGITELHPPSFEEIVKRVFRHFPVTSGYEMQSDNTHDFIYETKMKKSLFGTLSSELNYEHLDWIASFESGSIRKLYKKNLLTKAQLELIEELGKKIKVEQYRDRFFVYKNGD